jgi:uncharacterized tellurite resistance protein B-like protein
MGVGQAAEIIDLFPDRTTGGKPKLNSADVELADLTGRGQPRGEEIVNTNDDVGGFFADTVDEDQFASNVAELMSASQRSAVADRLVEYFTVDLSARENWSGLVDRALILLGIEKVDLTQLPFPGAASVQHPVIAEACTQFQSNAIEEFFPPTGPVKGSQAGQATPESEAAGERAEDYMNFYLTAEDTDYYADTDQMLFYLPIIGSVFRKVFHDPRDQKPKARYVKSEDFVAPYGARDLKNASRYCHQYTMTGQEIKRAQNRGEFLDIRLPRVDNVMPDEKGSTGTKMEDKSNRMTRVVHEDDQIYQILEYHIDFTLPGEIDRFDDGMYEPPYIITVDRENREVLSIRRNWKEVDPTYAKRVWFTHYKFLPGLGFYGWGFLHVIGSLAEAISGSIRALLDSSLMATVQGGFRAKDGIKQAGSVSIEPGKWKDLDATYEDLSKTFYTPPFREPSPALANLITGMVADARRYASLTETLVGTADNKAPVGTTLALIEQSMKVFTAIHKRIFAAAREEFRMLAELMYEYGPEEYPYFLEGEAKTALKQDFDDRIDFLPVADPNIISSVQRIAMAQAQVELVNSDPTLFGPEQKVEAYKRLLKALKVPMSEAVEPKLRSASRLDPIGENANLLTGKSVKAFPGQLHRQHNSIHQYAIDMAKNTMPPDMFKIFFQNATSHMREHDALEMVEKVSASMQQTMGVPLPEMDYLGQGGEDMPAELEQAITVAASQNMPPMIGVQPGSVAEEQQQQAQQPDPMAEAEAKNKAREAETQGRMETEGMKTVAQIKRDDEIHKQKMKQAEELHQAKLKNMSEETAAQIIRDAAKAKQQQQHEAQKHVSALTAESHTMSLRDRQQAAKEKAAKAKTAKKKTAKKRAA